MRDLSSESDGVLGFNTSHRGLSTGQVDLLPVAGVRHGMVEELHEELSKGAFFGTMTIVSPLRYLLPLDPGMWIYDDGPMGERSAIDIMQVVRDYGLPWMSVHASLEGILEAMRAGQCYTDTTLPIVLHLLGRNNEARREAEAAMKSYDEKPNPAEWDEERGFFERLLELIDSS